MSSEPPPIVKLAERLLLEVERAVSIWSRQHKYVLGARLRDQAMEVATLANRAWRDRKRQRDLVEELVWAVDGLKLCLQLGSGIKAFTSFEQFEGLARVASDLGKQCGGWRRQLQHLKGESTASRQDAVETQDTEYPRRLGKAQR